MPPPPSVSPPSSRRPWRWLNLILLLLALASVLAWFHLIAPGLPTEPPHTIHSAAQSPAPHVQIVSELHTELNGQTREVRLPYFVTQGQSGLLTVHWHIHLPEHSREWMVPGLLVPQPVQGMRLSINNEVFYELPSSSDSVWLSWYRPVLIQIPPYLLNTQGPTPLLIEQTGHLRGWFMAPLMLGELSELRPYYDGFHFISQTLTITSNVLSILAGLFLLSIGLRSLHPAYSYSGLAAIVWGVLFSLALIHALPAEWWWTWRLALYFLTGLLIYSVSLFMLHAFDALPGRRTHLAMLAYLQLGWILFAFGGARIEGFLDIYWTGLAVLIYVVSAGVVIIRAWRLKQYRRVLPVLAHWAFTSATAFHDYTLQAGDVLWKTADTGTMDFWQFVFSQHIYLADLALPTFVIMAFFLLTRDHLEKTRNTLLHERRLNQLRQDILNDIHDGVGARLNLMLWDLRLNGLPSAAELESELQRCTDEMRFAIQPPGATAQTLEYLLGNLCKRLQISGQQLGIELSYQEFGQASPGLSSTAGHELYKACQECLSNALRHSQASRIEVSLHHQGDELLLHIRDNGRGIAHWDNLSQRQTMARADAMGLKSLRSRFAGLGGSVHIQSGPEGTLMSFRLSSQVTSRHRHSLREVLPLHPWIQSFQRLQQIALRGWARISAARRSKS